MKQVQLHELDPGGGGWRQIATLEVVDGELVITGDRSTVDKMVRVLTVLDPETKRPITFHENPPRWVHYLPRTVRGPYTVATGGFLDEDGVGPSAEQMAKDLGLAPAPPGRFDELFGDLPGGPA